MKALGALWAVAFAAGFLWAHFASAEGEPAKGAPASKREPRVIYPKRTELDFEGTQIEGDVKNAGDFYFQHKPEEKFDSLVKRRKNFHPEMLRDVVLSK